MIEQSLVLTLALVFGLAHTNVDSPSAPPAAQKPADTTERAIRDVLAAQVAAWNKGDIDGFMDGYLHSDATRFASGGTVTRGWETVRDRYKQRYATRERMGTLEFTELEVTVTSSDSAVAFGRWRLTRASDTPSGLFTLVFRQTDKGWKIVADHTSSADEH